MIKFDNRKKEDRTKFDLADAMKELMIKEDVDTISVKDICQKAMVSRSTFYQHFQDKYDLINWYFDKVAAYSFNEMGNSITLHEAFLRKYTIMKEEDVFFAAAFKSRSQNNLIEYDYHHILNFFTDFIYRKKRIVMDEELDFLLRLYCSGAIYITAQWAVNGMPETPKVMAERLIKSLPPRLYEIFDE